MNPVHDGNNTTTMGNTRKDPREFPARAGSQKAGVDNPGKPLIFYLLVSKETEGQVTRPGNNQQKLLEAGLELLCEKKPEEVSMEEVAAKAGVTKPMVYYYFGSKAGFYRKLVDHIEETLSEMVTECLFPGITFRQALRNIIVMRIDQTINQPELSNGVRLMATSMHICGVESRGRMYHLFNRLDPVFREAIGSGEIRADSDLQLIMGMMNSLLEGAMRIHGPGFFERIGPETFAGEVIRMIFDGIGTGERTSK